MLHLNFKGRWGTKHDIGNRSPGETMITPAWDTWQKGAHAWQWGGWEFQIPMDAAMIPAFQGFVFLLFLWFAVLYFLVFSWLMRWHDCRWNRLFPVWLFHIQQKCPHPIHLFLWFPSKLIRILDLLFTSLCQFHGRIFQSFFDFFLS